MTSIDPTSADPGFRCRIALYLTQFLGAMAVGSLGPLLDIMMRDLGVPLNQGGLLSAAGFRLALALVAVPALACGLSSFLIHKRTRGQPL